MIRHRRSQSPTSVLAGALVLSLALVAAACNNDPAVPELTDPTAILQAAATQTASATAVHMDLAADGELRLDLTGTGVAAPLSLADTTVSADLDIAGGDARVTFALPGIMGLRGELIAVDGTAWVKTTVTGPLYREVPMGGALPTDPAASPDTASMLEALSDFLEQPGLDPVKGEDVECGTTTCYTVQIQLTPEELAALGGDAGEIPIPTGLPIPIPDLGDIGIDLTIRVEKATTRLAGLTAVATAGEIGELTAELTFSKWNEAVSVSPPPADQIGSAVPRGIVTEPIADVPGAESSVSEHDLYRDSLLSPTFDVLSEQPGFQDGGLAADADEIVVYWKGEFGPEAQAAVDEANVRGLVVRVIWVPYSYDELRVIAGRLVTALDAKGIETDGYRLGDPFDEIAVWGPALDGSAEARRVAKDTAAEVLPPDMDFEIITSPGEPIPL